MLGFHRQCSLTMAHMTDMFSKTNEYAHIIVGYIPQHIPRLYLQHIPIISLCSWVLNTSLHSHQKLD